jgi:hypothetical protein
MPRGWGRRPRRANPVAQPARRGNRRRTAVVDDDELPQLRQRLDVPHRLPEQEPERPVQPTVEAEHEIAPLGEVNQIFDEPLLMPGFNEVDIFVCQKVKDKIWNFEYIDLALMLRSNFNNQHNSEDTIGLNDGVLVIQKKV